MGKTYIKLSEYGSVVISDHVKQRGKERLVPLLESGVITREELTSLLESIFKKGKQLISVFRKKVRVTASKGRFELLVVLAPLRGKDGFELVTLWSPSHNKKG